MKTNYQPGEQFIFYDEIIRIVACRRLTREGYVIRFFEDGGKHGMYILAREEHDSSEEIPEERLVVKRMDEIAELTEEDRQQIRNAAEMPIIFDRDCPHWPIEHEDEIVVDFERARLDTPHAFDEFDQRFSNSVA